MTRGTRAALSPAAGDYVETRRTIGTVRYRGSDGRILSRADVGGHTTSYEYEDALGRLQYFGYDRGYVTQKRQDEEGGMDAQWDYGRIKQATNRAGEAAYFTHHLGTGQVQSIQRPLGRATYFAYDAHGFIASRRDLPDRTKLWQHDEYGRVQQHVVDAEGHATPQSEAERQRC